jgi:hypothetical protein
MHRRSWSASCTALEITSEESCAATAVAVVVSITATPVINARFSSFIGRTSLSPLH